MAKNQEQPKLYAKPMTQVFYQLGMYTPPMLFAPSYLTRALHLGEADNNSVFKNSIFKIEGVE